MKRSTALFCSAVLLTAALCGCRQAPAGNDAPESLSVPESSSTEAAPTPEPATPTPAPTEEPAKEEYVPGERTDTDYTSTTLGLRFTLPENMVMASDEEINQLMQVSVDMMYEDPDTGEMIIDYSQLNTVYEMMAIDVSTGSNVIVMSEKLPLAAMTEEQYITAMEKQLEQTTVDVDFGEPEPYTLGATDFTMLSYSVAANGTQMNQVMLLKKVTDRMYAVTISYPDTAELAPLLDCFSVAGAAV